MSSHHRSSPQFYNTSPYTVPAYGTVSYQVAPLDVTWYRTWPNFKAIFLSIAIIICSTAIIGLEIANLAIEGSKQGGTSRLGLGTGKVGAGIWCGSMSFLAAIFILVIVFTRNKRITAIFALLVVTLAFLFIIVLIGLTGNAIQTNLYMNTRTDAETVQNKLLIGILAIATVILILCLGYFIMFIRVFFSTSTRQLSRHW